MDRAAPFAHLPHPRGTTPEVLDRDTHQGLTWSLDDVAEENRRADQKAGHLLTLFGALAAVTVATARYGALPPASVVALWLSAGSVALAMVRLLLVIRPNLDGAPFARFAVLPAWRILADHRETEPHYYADRLRARSAATLRKHRGIRAAVHLVLIGGGYLVVAAVLAVVFR